MSTRPLGNSHYVSGVYIELVLLRCAPKGFMNFKKIAIIVGIIILLGAIVGFTVSQTQKNVVAVQTGKVMKQDISSVVTSSGEIKPLNYVNVGANAMGRIVHLYVKEGDKVKKGQLLAQLENVQSSADVEQMRATLASSQTDALASEAGLKTALARSNSSHAGVARAKLDYERAEGLFKSQLISRQDYDAKKATYEVAQAVPAQQEHDAAQSPAPRVSPPGRLSHARAQLIHARDLLNKTTYTAPYDRVFTNLTVHDGETVVMGIQNAPGSTLMTVSDMAVGTAEVHVYQTHILNTPNR